MFDSEKAFVNYEYIKQMTSFQVLFVLEPYYKREKQLKSKLHLSIVDLSLAPTPAVGDSVAHIL